MPIKVLIVDDSAIVRDVLSTKLAQYPDIDIVGVAPDPFIARDKIVQLQPDVLTLDIEMPRMDGLTFLERLMSYFPLPVIIVSSVTTDDKHAAITALEIGAFDVVNKPGGAISVGDIVEEIVYKIRQAYEVRTSFTARRKAVGSRYGNNTPRPAPVAASVLGTVRTTDKVLCIGASTGGTVALEYLVRQFPAGLPPVLVVQHMPPGFTRQFAERLDTLSALTIVEAVGGELLASGTMYIAPGGWHLEIERRGASLYTKLTNGERVHFQRPAVDVLFQSVARTLGRNAAAALLTGMGRDGAEGLLALKKAGARTIAQDEASSVVWGMPQAAVEIGAAGEVLALDRIAARLTALVAEL
jgi:two-component system chemotaxis response regulator CheB